jgi:hypothetical protein
VTERTAKQGRRGSETSHRATVKTYLNLAVYERDLAAEEDERRRITKALPAGAA